MTTFCRMVASAQSEAALSNRYVAEHLRIPRQLYERKLCGDASFNDREVLGLFAILPALLVEIAQSNGYRCVAMTERGQRADVVHAATKSIRAVSEVGAYAMDALADGRIDRMEGIALDGKLGDGRQALADLEASLNAARVA